MSVRESAGIGYCRSYLPVLICKPHWEASFYLSQTHNCCAVYWELNVLETTIMWEHKVCIAAVRESLCHKSVPACLSLRSPPPQPQPLRTSTLAHGAPLPFTHYKQLSHEQHFYRMPIWFSIHAQKLDVSSLQPYFWLRYVTVYRSISLDNVSWREKQTITCLQKPMHYRSVYCTANGATPFSFS